MENEGKIEKMKEILSQQENSFNEHIQREQALIRDLKGFFCKKKFI